VGIIAGAAAGGGVALVVAVALMVYFMRRNKGGEGVVGVRATTSSWEAQKSAAAAVTGVPISSHGVPMPILQPHENNRPVSPGGVIVMSHEGGGVTRVVDNTSQPRSSDASGSRPVTPVA
jgi:hypothetical protein